MFFNRSTRVLICALPFVATLTSPANSAEYRSAVQPSAASAYAGKVISGGIGSGTRQELEQRAQHFELKLVFAATPSGDYLADIPVTIRDRQGNTVVEAISEGPWMYVELPNGAYTVTAQHAGRTEIREVSVRAGSQRTLYVRFPQRSESMSLGAAAR